MSPGVEKNKARAPNTVSSGTAPVLKLSGVSFAWEAGQDFTLKIDDFVVSRGEKLLLNGPSGSGKSTLLSLVCGVVWPDEGSIEVAGQETAGLRGGAADRFRAEHFGIVFQMFNLLPYATVFDNIVLPLSFARERRTRVGQDRLREEAGRLMQRLQLDAELLGRRAATLSIGQQQRVAVARALIGRPEIVIADEPTSALDSVSQSAFMALLFDEVREAGATLIMVSHDETLSQGFDRVLGLDEIQRRP